MRLQRDVGLAIFLAAAVTLLYGGLFVFSPDGAPFTPPQLDSMLYYRYAKAMAEGHPYRLEAGAEASTGSTSHLYPALLALLYRMGAGGDNLAVAGFLLGIVFLVGTLAASLLILRRLEPGAAGLGISLVALSGHTTFTLFGQSDMSLFIPLALGAWASALYRNARWLAVLLVLCAFCRPEGMMLSALLVVVAGALRVWSGDRAWTRVLAAGAAGTMASLGALILNWTLTDAVQFQSVMGKGYFHDMPFWGACRESGHDFFSAIGDIFVGVTSRNHRCLYLLPVTGGILFLAGLVLRERGRKDGRPLEWWFLGGGLVSMCVIAASGFAGIAHDRYLGWILTVVYLYGAVGVERTARLFSRTGRLAPWLSGILVMYQAIGLAWFLQTFSTATGRTGEIVRFVRQTHERLPPDACVGTVGRSGLGYYMPGRKLVNVSGIGAPAFLRQRHFIHNVEELKHRPDLRVDYWLVYPSDLEKSWISPFLGERVAAERRKSDSSGLAVHRATWDLFEHALWPATPPAVRVVSGMNLVDQLDVGYEHDELAHGRVVANRTHGQIMQPFATALPLAGNATIEVGEIVLGAENFRIRTTPGRPVRMVMRTLGKATCATLDSRGECRVREYEMAGRQNLVILVNGITMGRVEIELKTSGAEFEEVWVDIAGGLISGRETWLTLGGDHIPCAFWFYQ